MARLVLLLLVLAAALPSSSHAAWKPYSVTHVAGTSNWVLPPISDGAGGAIVAWLNIDTDAVYAQRVRDTDHADPAWPSNGVLVTSSGNELGIVGDGAHGAVIVVISASGTDIRAWHVLSTGTLDPAWPAPGVLVRTGSSNVYSIYAVSDGAGGATVAWIDERNYATSDLDLYAHRVRSNGTTDPGWPVNGAALCVAPGLQNMYDVVSDGSGGLIAVWVDNRIDYFYDAYAQRILATGAIASGWPAGGRILCDDPSSQSSPLACSDGAGGAIVAWTDDRSYPGQPGDIYAMRVQANGHLASGWPADGKVIHDYLDSGLGGLFYDIVADGSGGAILVWGAPNNNPDIYVSRIKGNAAFAWADPVHLSEGAQDEYPAVLAPDGSGGAFVAWSDGRFSTQNNGYAHDLYVHHVVATGVPDPAWREGGTRASFTNLPNYFGVAMGSTDAGGAIVIAGDGMSGLFGINLSSTWNEFYRLRVAAVPSTDGTVNIDPLVPSYGAGQVVTLTAIPNPGISFHSWSWDASGTANPLPLTMTRSMFVAAVFPNAIVGVDEPGAELALRVLSLGPAQGPVSVEYSIPTAGHVSLGVYDLAGRQLARLVDGESSAGHHVTTWDTHDLSPNGIYFIRLVSPAGIRTSRLARIR